MNKIALIFLLLLVSTISEAFELSSKSHRNLENQFEIQAPKKWVDVVLRGRIVWQVAESGGYGPKNCGLIVTEDYSFGMLTPDEYISAQSQDKLISVLKAQLSNPTINVWEPKFSLSGKRALHYVYTGILDNEKQTSFGIQTIRGNRLFTFFCNAPSDEFPFVYHDFLTVSDSFSFLK